MREVVIIDALCTPIGRYAGALSLVRPDYPVLKSVAQLLNRIGA